MTPHSGLGNLAPSIYAGLSAPKMQRDGTLRYTEGSAPNPLRHRASRLKSTRDSTHRWTKEGAQVKTLGHTFLRSLSPYSESILWTAGG